MIDPLIRWSLHNRVAILALACVLTLLGIYTAPRMPVDVFPDLTAPTVTVITEAHGMAPTEVESQVTFPDRSGPERRLRGAAGALVDGGRHCRRLGGIRLGHGYLCGPADRQREGGADCRRSPAGGGAPGPRARLVDYGRDPLSGADVDAAQPHGPADHRGHRAAPPAPVGAGRLPGDPHRRGRETVPGRARPRETPHLWRDSAAGDRRPRRRRTPTSPPASWS